jgi:DNA invertase Pin-like site-specific DNA recombinase
VKVGSARVSTQEQHLDLQLDALHQEGCEAIYQEQVSGAKTDRPELAWIPTIP